MSSKKDGRRRLLHCALKAILSFLEGNFAQEYRNKAVLRGAIESLESYAVVSHTTDYFIVEVE